jgi:hypothetical protein
VNDLAIKVQELARIRTGESVYGSGDAQEQSLRFYYDQVLGPVITQFCARTEHLRTQFGEVALLVSMLGFSPETAVLSCHALYPRRLLVLYSGNAADSIGTVRRFVAGEKSGLLSASRFVAQECPPTEPAGIGTIIEKAVADVRGTNKDARIVVDITGGKKVMSAAAALAAARLGLPVVYIDGEYDPKIRRPKPGTENLVVISDGCESSVCRLGLDESLRLCDDATHADAGRNQLPFLLADIAVGQASAGEFTLAGLLHYRCIEACIKARLAHRAPRFSCSNPDYAQLPLGESDLLAAMNAHAEQIGSEMKQTTLPRTVGVMNAALILLALDDCMLNVAGVSDEDGLRALHEVTRLRNSSVLAHGNHILNREEAERMAALSARILDAYQDVIDGAMCR